MSGFTGKTVTTENVPGDVKGLRSNFSSFLQQQGFGGLNTGTPDLEAYQKLFQQQNEQTFAQAKESAGNLTGSGYGARIGRAAQEASTEQGGFLANLLEQSKQQNASRLAQVLMPFLTAGVASPTTSYQPGFLDYAASAGTSLAAGGAFNNTFGAGGTKK